MRPPIISKVFHYISLCVVLTVAQKFRLLDLPAELWSKIGKLVIQDAPFCNETTIGRVGKPTEQSRAAGLGSTTRVHPVSQQVSQQQRWYPNLEFDL